MKMRRLLSYYNYWGYVFFWLGFCINESMADEYSLITPPPQPPPPPSPFLNRQNVTAFRPSIAVIVAVLTTMFSVTFLLLLYAKHCKRNNGYDGNPNSSAPNISTARRNSGIDRSIIESLPIFRFSSLRGHKEGLDCSVCLNRFEGNEVLRLLPKCKHAFHVECVDTWLDAHSTCPLCRYRVDPEDVLLIEQIKLDNKERSIEDEEMTRKSEEITRRISGRHSSAGERKSNLLQIVIQRPGESTRKSVDSAVQKRNETVAVGCFDRVRKDGQLLSSEEDRENLLQLESQRFDHRITLSSENGVHKKRWSGLRPSDLLFLQSEMILRNSGRYSLSSHREKKEKVRVAEDEEEEDGRSVIKTRSVSEITGLNRFDNGT